MKEFDETRTKYIDGKLFALKTDVAKLVDRYNKLSNKDQDKNSVEAASVAFVTFRSMEGAARCKQAHSRERS